MKALAIALRYWLMAFLGVVGAMKAAGLLRHPLSRIAGAVEAAGAVCHLPFVALDLLGGHSNLKQRRGAETWNLVGCHFYSLALGMILSTYKRKGVVCWSQALLTIIYVLVAYPPAASGEDKRIVDGRRVAVQLALILLVGGAIGMALQSAEIDVTMAKSGGKVE